MSDQVSKPATTLTLEQIMADLRERCDIAENRRLAAISKMLPINHEYEARRNAYRYALRHLECLATAAPSKSDQASALGRPLTRPDIVASVEHAMRVSATYLRRTGGLQQGAIADAQEIWADQLQAAREEVLPILDGKEQLDRVAELEERLTATNYCVDVIMRRIGMVTTESDLLVTESGLEDALERLSVNDPGHHPKYDARQAADAIRAEIAIVVKAPQYTSDDICPFCGVLRGKPHKWKCVPWTNNHEPQPTPTESSETEQIMHAAWRKRAEEAEAEVAQLIAGLPQSHHRGEFGYCDLCGAPPDSEKTCREAMMDRAHARSTSAYAVDHVVAPAHPSSPAPAWKEHLRRLEDIIVEAEHHQPMYNGRPSCPFCENFTDEEGGHDMYCIVTQIRELRKEDGATMDHVPSVATEEPEGWCSICGGFRAGCKMLWGEARTWCVHEDCLNKAFDEHPNRSAADWPTQLAPHQHECMHTDGDHSGDCICTCGAVYPEYGLGDWIEPTPRGPAGDET
jgi:hypothetical protein